VLRVSTISLRSTLTLPKSPVRGLVFALAIASAAAAEDYAAGIGKWRAGQETRLRSDRGALTYAGLFWLGEGKRRAGSAAGNEFMLPSAAPPRFGEFTMRGGNVSFTPQPGVAVSRDGKPVTASIALAENDRLVFGEMELILLRRAAKTGLRLLDKQSKLRREFTGRRWYPVKPEARVQATFLPRPERTVVVDSIIGQPQEYVSKGLLSFRWKGQEHTVEPVIEGDELFLIFRDRTAGKTTYGAGRFLYAELPRDGVTVLDFNKAVNPPCAFTPYATCPLPPPQNRLTFAIEAGETYSSH